MLTGRDDFVTRYRYSRGAPGEIAWHSPKWPRRFGGILRHDMFTIIIGFIAPVTFATPCHGETRFICRRRDLLSSSAAISVLRRFRARLCAIMAIVIATRLDYFAGVGRVHESQLHSHSVELRPESCWLSFTPTPLPTSGLIEAIISTAAVCELYSARTLEGVEGDFADAFHYRSALLAAAE